MSFDHLDRKLLYIPLAEDCAVEGAVEDDADAHQILLALHLQVLDLRHRRRLRHLPRVKSRRRGRGRCRRGSGVENC